EVARKRAGPKEQVWSAARKKVSEVLLLFKRNLGFFLSLSTPIHRRRASQHARLATSGECREPATPSPLNPSELFPRRASIGSWQACAETSLRLLQVVQQSATRESGLPSAPRASRPAR